MSQPRVELLYFDGCPNYERTRELVERVAAELELAPSIELVNVSDPDAAITRRFLGSPTVRIDGRDVEPGAQERRDSSWPAASTKPATALPASRTKHGSARRSSGRGERAR